MVRNFNTRILAHLLIGCTVTFLHSAFATAGTVSIFDLHKSLPLEASDPVFHDFYINAGQEVGMKKGMFVNVVRKVPVHDPIQNKAAGQLTVPIARLQIIHVERGLSVGRLHSEVADEDRPTVDFEGIMIGDVLDMDSVTMEAPVEKKRRKAGVALITSLPIVERSQARNEPSKPTDHVQEKAPEHSSELAADKTPEKSASSVIKELASPLTSSSATVEKASAKAASPGMVEQPIPRKDDVAPASQKEQKGT